MASSAKGKEKVIDGGKGSSGKRKRNIGVNDDGKTGGRKRKNRGVLQFFDDAAYEVDEDDASDDSFFDDDSLEDEFETTAAAMQFQSEPSKAPFLPFVPKEEEPTEEELEKMLQERYKPASTFVTYAEDNYESKRTMEMPEYHPSVKDPIIWKVKCMVGRERHSAFCLMQKYVDLQFLGKKLQIISAFTIDHVKGFIYIEAEKQCDINEACNGLCSIYSSRVAPVSKDDIYHLFSVKNKSNGISEGMWARVKNGKYKGDLAQVVAVNSARKKVTVKLIPRIDLQALAEKFGRGITANRGVNPAPRLISSSELEEFRPLIQCRRDRDTNKVFEVLDGMMLKDGYLYKKVSIDSLSFWGATPTEDELLKFEPSRNDEYKDLEWLSQLYGEQKKKRPLVRDKGGGKGEGSSTPSLDTDFEVHDLVFFGRKDFGVVIGSEKDESFKIIKEGSEGPVVVTIPRKELKNASFDKKLFTALDQKMKNISINDRVRVLDGPMKDREGIVKKIYRGIIFLYNETVEENSGYICFKTQLCEKVELPGEAHNEKGGEQETVVFGDFASSPKSPLSPKQSDQGRDGSCNFNRENNTMFSVGQSLRIRVGPLKGYLCRVLAIQRSDITVKLDSQHKILTVKCEHLAEVRPKSSGISLGEESDSLKPFDLLGTQDGSTDWLDGTAKAAEGGSWNAEGFSTERSSWPAFPVSNFSLPTEAQSSSCLVSVDEANKGDSSWEVKPTPSQGPSWDAAAAARQTSGDGGQAANWGNQEDSHKKGAFSADFVGNASDSWGQAVESVHQSTTQGLKEDSWGVGAGSLSIKDDSSGSKAAWNASGVASEKPTTGWGNASGGSDQPDANAWNKVTTSNIRETERWQTTRKDGEGAGGRGKDAEESAWNPSARVIDGGSLWNKQDGESFGNKLAGGSSWSKPDGGSTSQSKQGGGSSSWGKPDGGSSSWGKPDGGSSSWGKPDGGSGSWSKLDGGSSSWSKPDGGSSSWSKPDGGSSSWSKPDGGSASWSKGVDSTENKGDTDQGGSWGRSESFGRARGSGGRSGRGGRGGRGQFGRGRSFGQGETSNWAKGNTDDYGFSGDASKGNNSSWNSGQADCWDKNVSSAGDKQSGWGKPNASGDNGESKWRGATKDTDEWGGKSHTGWNGGQANDQEGIKGLASNESSGWQKKDKSWDQKSDGSKMDMEAGKDDPWNSKKTSEGGGASDAGGGSSSGWGQSKWSGETETRGKQNSWSSKSNWNSDNKFGSNEEKNDTFDDRGRCGNWRGGQGGRWGQDIDGSGGIKGLASNESSDWQKKDKSWDQKSNDSKIDVEAGKDDPWNSQKTSEGGSNSGWGQSKWGRATDAGRGSSSGWGQSKWGGATDAGRGSSSGRGQSRWSGETETGGKQNSWSSKSNWNSDNKFGSNEEKNDTSDDQGRCGNWREGRGGRWGQDRDGSGGIKGLDQSWDQKSDDSKMDVEAGKDDPRNSQKTSGGGSTLGWGQSKWGGATDAGQGSSSGWGQSKWGGASDAAGGSSSGSGQSKWSGETETGVKQNTWSSKSNWNSDNNFGSDEGKNGNFDNQGRGGNWRGGRGGRWGQDRDGFGGRGSERGGFEGHSDHGGFGGRDRSGRGRFGGRGQSDRGDFGDFGWRGGSDRGGFHGRGGFGGRGRGRRDDWNKNDSVQDKSYSYNNMSNKDVNWKSSGGGGNWNGGDHDKGQWQSGNSGWVAAGEGDSGRAGGWNKGSNNAGGSGNDGVCGKGQWQSGNSGWAAVGEGDTAQAGGWNKGSNSAGGTGAQCSGWNHGVKDAASGDKPNSWKNGSSGNTNGWVGNASGGNWQGGDTNQWLGAGSGWNKSKAPAESGDIEQAGGCTRELTLSKDVGGSDSKSSGWNSQNNNWKTSDSSGGATSSSWNQPAMGKGEGAGTADAWGKAPASSWGLAKDGNDKGHW